MALYNAPPSAHPNVDLNSVGSLYASQFGHSVSNLIQKATNKAIFDASPQQFFDLKLLNMKPAIPVNSDEFFYQEMGYQRSPITLGTGGISAAASTDTAVAVTSGIDQISEDSIIINPSDNSKMTVTNVNVGAGTIDVASINITGTAPNLTVAASGDKLPILSSVEGDAREGFAQYFRASTIERQNYVQLFNKAIRYGEIELFKLRNAATTGNFLDMERNAMMRQFRIDLSNAFWNGQKGEATLAATTGQPTLAKTTHGVYPAMIDAGSPNTAATSANLKAAFEDMVLSSEYGEYGQVRFAFMSPRTHLALSAQYKDTYVRYSPTDDGVTKLQLKEIDVGSSRIVLVPFSRFTDDASFGTDWSSRIMILDMANIYLRNMFGERSGETLSREQGIPKRYKEIWVDANMGIQFNNPLACAYINYTA